MTAIDTMKNLLLPLYLLCIVLLQIDLTVQNILLGCLPLVVILIAIYLKNKPLGFIGFVCFYMISISVIMVPSFNDFFRLALNLIFLLLPSLMLLSSILQLGQKKIPYHAIQKKPLLIAASLLIAILTIFFLILFIVLGDYLHFAQLTESEILILAGITLIICTPFLLRGETSQ
jgi:hypothetical protein